MSAPTIRGRGRKTCRGSLVLPLVLGCSLLATASVHVTAATAQVSDTCGGLCTLTLGATAFTTATGTVVALSRLTGGLSTKSQALLTWGSTFALVTGAGVMLDADSNQQERGIYGAGLGTVAGGLLALAVDMARPEGTSTSHLAGALMGAAAGAVLGGLFGALSENGNEVFTPPPPILSVHLPLGGL